LDQPSDFESGAENRLRRMESGLLKPDHPLLHHCPKWKNYLDLKLVSSISKRKKIIEKVLMRVALVKENKSH
jgi:hypothetical protein